MNTLRERVARAMAAEHYAERFSKPVNDAHVQANVDANWQIWTIRAEPIIALFLAALRREPTDAMIAAGLDALNPWGAGVLPDPQGCWSAMVGERVKEWGE